MKVKVGVTFTCDTPFSAYPVGFDLAHSTGAQAVADLTAHRAVIHYRSPSNPAPNEKQKKRSLAPLFLFGLPGRIRTCDLESRSLTRYPAVPRVEIFGFPYPMLILYHRFADL